MVTVSWAEMVRRSLYKVDLECICGFVYFFFQAEDGIRDAQESRGLGDVYKRQMIDGALMAKLLFAINPEKRLILLGDKDQLASVEAVSYTHLTLPTIYSV